MTSLAAEIRAEVEVLQKDVGVAAAAYGVKTQAGTKFQYLFHNQQEQLQRMREPQKLNNTAKSGTVSTAPRYIPMPFIRKFDPSQPFVPFRRRASPRVLIVDDNLIHAAAAKISFERYFREVYVAANGKQALELMEHRVFDIVFLDAVMPLLCGPETCDIIRQTESAAGAGGFRTFVCAMVTFEESRDEGIMDACLVSGMDRYVVKPLLSYARIFCDTLSAGVGTAEGWRRKALERQWVARHPQLLQIIGPDVSADEVATRYAPAAMTKNADARAERVLLASIDDTPTREAIDDMLARQRADESAQLVDRAERMRAVIGDLEWKVEELTAQNATMRTNRNEATVFALEARVRVLERQLADSRAAHTAEKQKSTDLAVDMRNLLENGNANEFTVRRAQRRAAGSIATARAMENRAMELEDGAAQGHWANYYGSRGVRVARKQPLPAFATDVGASWFFKSLTQLVARVVAFTEGASDRDRHLVEYVARRVHGGGGGGGNLVLSATANNFTGDLSATANAVALSTTSTGVFGPQATLSSGSPGWRGGEISATVAAHAEDDTDALRALRRDVDEFIASHLAREAALWQLAGGDDDALARDVAGLVDGLRRQRMCAMGASVEVQTEEFDEFGDFDNFDDGSSVAKPAAGSAGDVSESTKNGVFLTATNTVSGTSVVGNVPSKQPASRADESPLDALRRTLGDICRSDRYVGAARRAAAFAAAEVAVEAAARRPLDALAEVSRELSSELRTVAALVEDPEHALLLKRPLPSVAGALSAKSAGAAGAGDMPPPPPLADIETALYNVSDNLRTLVELAIETGENYGRASAAAEAAAAASAAAASTAASEAAAAAASIETTGLETPVSVFGLGGNPLLGGSRRLSLTDSGAPRSDVGDESLEMGGTGGVPQTTAGGATTAGAAVATAGLQTAAQLRLAFAAAMALAESRITRKEKDLNRRATQIGGKESNAIRGSSAAVPAVVVLKHRVGPGETLAALAGAFGCSVADIASRNPRASAAASASPDGVLDALSNAGEVLSIPARPAHIEARTALAAGVGRGAGGGGGVNATAAAAAASPTAAAPTAAAAPTGRRLSGGAAVPSAASSLPIPGAGSARRSVAPPMARSNRLRSQLVAATEAATSGASVCVSDDGAQEKRLPRRRAGEPTSQTEPIGAEAETSPPRPSKPPPGAMPASEAGGSPRSSAQKMVKDLRGARAAPLSLGAAAAQARAAADTAGAEPGETAVLSATAAIAEAARGALEAGVSVGMLGPPVVQRTFECSTAVSDVATWYRTTEASVVAANAETIAHHQALKRQELIDIVTNVPHPGNAVETAKSEATRAEAEETLRRGPYAWLAVPPGVPIAVPVSRAMAEAVADSLTAPAPPQDKSSAPTTGQTAATASAVSGSEVLATADASAITAPSQPAADDALMFLRGAAAAVGRRAAVEEALTGGTVAAVAAAAIGATPSEVAAADAASSALAQRAVGPPVHGPLGPAANVSAATATATAASTTSPGAAAAVAGAAAAAAAAAPTRHHALAAAAATAAHAAIPPPSLADAELRHAAVSAAVAAAIAQRAPVTVVEHRFPAAAAVTAATGADPSVASSQTPTGRGAPRTPPLVAIAAAYGVSLAALEALNPGAVAVEVAANAAAARVAAGSNGSPADASLTDSAIATAAAAASHAPSRQSDSVVVVPLRTTDVAALVEAHSDELHTALEHAVVAEALSRAAAATAAQEAQSAATKAGISDVSVLRNPSPGRGGGGTTMIRGVPRDRAEVAAIAAAAVAATAAAAASVESSRVLHLRKLIAEHKAATRALTALVAENSAVAASLAATSSGRAAGGWSHASWAASAAGGVDGAVAAGAGHIRSSRDGGGIGLLPSAFGGWQPTSGLYASTAGIDGIAAQAGAVQGRIAQQQLLGQSVTLAQWSVNGAGAAELAVVGDGRGQRHAAAVPGIPPMDPSALTAPPAAASGVSASTPASGAWPWTGRFPVAATGAPVQGNSTPLLIRRVGPTPGSISFGVAAGFGGLPPAALPSPTAAARAAALAAAVGGTKRPPFAGGGITGTHATGGGGVAGLVGPSTRSPEAAALGRGLPSPGVVPLGFGEGVTPFGSLAAGGAGRPPAVPSLRLEDLGFVGAPVAPGGPSVGGGNAAALVGRGPPVGGAGAAAGAPMTVRGAMGAPLVAFGILGNGGGKAHPPAHAATARGAGSSVPPHVFANVRLGGDGPSDHRPFGDDLTVSVEAIGLRRPVVATGAAGAPLGPSGGGGGSTAGTTALPHASTTAGVGGSAGAPPTEPVPPPVEEAARHTVSPMSRRADAAAGGGALSALFAGGSPACHSMQAVDQHPSLQLAGKSSSGHTAAATVPPHQQQQQQHPSRVPTPPQPHLPFLPRAAPRIDWRQRQEDARREAAAALKATAPLRSGAVPFALPPALRNA